VTLKYATRTSDSVKILSHFSSEQVINQKSTKCKEPKPRVSRTHQFTKRFVKQQQQQTELLV
jgi:hypothetical protein